MATAPTSDADVGSPEEQRDQEQGTAPEGADDAATDADTGEVDGTDDFGDDGGGEGGGGGGDEGGGVWLSWSRLVVLLAAVAFLAGAVVYYVEQRPADAGAVDVGFYQDMTTHHDQAVSLSMIELVNGEDPTVLSFAREILIFQNRELGIMATRLEDWGESGERPARAMRWMGMDVAPDQMPGMATEEQVDALQAARGRAADELFLELMAEHHRGGIHMASYAAEHAEKAEVRELAARIARFQAVEINEMAQTAEQLGMDVDIERVEVPPEP